MDLTDKQRREQREFETLFKNPKHARQMWAQKVFDRFSRPAMKPIMVVIDDKGNLSRESQIEMAIYDQLVEELKQYGLSRPPTDGEFMEACQSYYSRHNSSSYVARRDTMGAKPIDETKQTHTLNNPYEDLSDEELILINDTLQAHRQRQLEEISCTEVKNEDI